jgi:hypothetical protein
MVGQIVPGKSFSFESFAVTLHRQKDNKGRKAEKVNTLN